MGIRLVVIDDNPHVRWNGRVYPINAAFHRFISAVLDVPGAPVAGLVHCVPLRDATTEPSTSPLDPRIEVIGTAPFDGIAGYVRHAPRLIRENARILRRATAGADLVFIKLPASNASLAALVAHQAGAKRFGWVAGSARAVGLGRWAGARGAGAGIVGLLYDAIGRAATIGGHRIVVGADLLGADDAPGTGVVASLVEPDEIRDRGGDRWPSRPGGLALAWAGRLVEGKGIEALLEGVARLGEAHPGQPVDLAILGDGPAGPAFVALASRLGVAGRVTWPGHVSDRHRYLDRLAAADLVVLPSPAEGFPKVVLDALAAGTPVLSTAVGEVGPLVEAQVVARIAAATAEGVADAVADLVADPARAARLRTAGRVFVEEHTRPAEAARLVDAWRRWWPTLPWDA